MSKTRLFCIPYAGGSASIYCKWNKLLRNDIDLFLVELAGRGKRLSEDFYNCFDEAVEDLFTRIKDYIDDDYAIFGHSLGCWLAFELAYKIHEKGYNPPKHIFLSGNRAPHIYKREKVMHKLPDEEFKKEILKLGGTPKEIFEMKELMELFTPILRADYKILDEYKFEEHGFPLNSDITVLNGIDDDLTHEDLESWRSYTTGQFKICNFKGDHFFLMEEPQKVTELINNTLSEK